ncbi:MAG TPA: glycerol-3-phosphate 1-O-acyltransferase PlsY [Candidatus Limnocylindria bacterium]|nr:glycerol-3-phosphate 1-O-acyltransferase PlsY [Candidatus Limnocylindria bacterium]
MEAIESPAAALLGLAAALVLGYVLGAIPFGVVIARLIGGADPRTVGSQRTGATNTVRALGSGWGLAVGLLDVAKGLVAAGLGAAIGAAVGLVPEWVAAGSCVAAVSGHIRSVFIGFRGGRGVATAAGGFLVLVPLALVIVIPIIGAVVAVTRYVSLGSIVGAISAPLVVAVLYALDRASGADIAYSAMVGALVVLAHADNIARLRAGTERRIGDAR